MRTIYEELGGEEILEKATAKFFERAVADPLLSLYLGDTDLSRVRQGFKHYVAALLGGKEAYRGRPLFQAHKGTQINDLAFDQFIALFLTTLKDFGVRADTVSKVGDKLNALKNDVVDSFEWTGRHFYAPESQRR